MITDTPAPVLEDVTIQVEGIDPGLLYGARDQHLQRLELAFQGVILSARGGSLRIRGESLQVATVQAVIKDLIDVGARKGQINEDDINLVIAMQQSSDASKLPLLAGTDVILKTHTGDLVRAKTINQRVIVDAITRNDIVFAIGPAGTGKTYTSVALAARALKDKQVRKIVLCRPAVEAGENLGFLPGGLRDKIDPYLRPLYDALEEMIEQEKLEALMAKNIIEIAPLAYMRGRTLNNAFVILDEAQNATRTQLKMFLTRLGVNSRAIITGDVTQTDLPTSKESGLMRIHEILDGITGIGFVYMNEQDVVRHKLIRDIIKAYDKHEKADAERKEQRRKPDQESQG
jgi:phosphate starvation-inducible protein PhoH and related proteins